MTVATQLYDNFRANVAEQMRRQGMTHARLAEELQVSRPYVSQLLAGTVATRRGVALETVENVARALQVKPTALLKEPKALPAAG